MVFANTKLKQDSLYVVNKTKSVLINWVKGTTGSSSINSIGGGKMFNIRLRMETIIKL